MFLRNNDFGLSALPLIVQSDDGLLEVGNSYSLHIKADVWLISLTPTSVSRIFTGVVTIKD
jgi:hypothetical protein